VLGVLTLDGVEGVEGAAHGAVVRVVDVGPFDYVPLAGYAEQTGYDHDHHQEEEYGSSEAG